MTDLNYFAVLDTYVKSVLVNNLTDPYETAGGASRGSTWIHSFDDPEPTYKYPLIQIEMLPSPSEILSIGPDWWDINFVLINVWFRVKPEFKITVDGNVLKQKKLVAYYLSQIRKVLKDSYLTFADAGIKGFKVENVSPPDFDSTTNTYAGAVRIQLYWFEQ
ncbi:hypothetical protein DRN69_06680 [Candidatus Pacearchaeota archaeon]|nr:MAG: hypothetical protein DRN69_06680 [Candidatus Pacearchaeota archaeon]